MVGIIALTFGIAALLFAVFVAFNFVAEVTVKSKVEVIEVVPAPEWHEGHAVYGSGIGGARR